MFSCSVAKRSSFLFLPFSVQKVGVCNVLPTVCEGAFDRLFSDAKINRWVGDFQVATGGGFWVAAGVWNIFLRRAIVSHSIARRWPMNSGRTIFAQIMDYLPTYEFLQCVERYPGNYKVKSFSCWDHFLSMAFAQLRLLIITNSDHMIPRMIWLQRNVCQRTLETLFFNCLLDREAYALTAVSKPTASFHWNSWLLKPHQRSQKIISQVSNRLSAKKKGPQCLPATPWFIWWALSGSNRQPTD